MNNETTPRTGCIDMWNAFMVKNAQFTMGSDIPLCPCTAFQPPTELISYEEAKRFFQNIVKHDPDCHKDAYVHFYIDDQKFDGIWQLFIPVKREVSSMSKSISGLFEWTIAIFTCNRLFRYKRRVEIRHFAH